MKDGKKDARLSHNPVTYAGLAALLLAGELLVERFCDQNWIKSKNIGGVREVGGEFNQAENGIDFFIVKSV